MSPRSKGQNEQIRQERRNQILQAAIPLFAMNGYSATGMSDVAKAVGISHGTVFLYFPTKDDLFKAALLEPMVEAEAHFQRIVGVPGTPLERIQRMVQDQMNYFRRMEPYIRLTQYVIGQRERFPELAQACFDFAARYTETIIPIIAEGQKLGELAPLPPVGVAWSYFSYLNGFVLIILDCDDTMFTELADGALRLFGPRNS